MRVEDYLLSVRGASHIKKGTPCQDACNRFLIDNEESVVLYGAADGHGSAKCPYSDEGAGFILDALYANMFDLYRRLDKDCERLVRNMHNEEIPFTRKLLEEWQRTVRKRHQDCNRRFPLKDSGENDDEALYQMYGTTVMGLLITPEYHFAIQIGDGNITEVSDGVATPFLEDDGILGVETYSVCDVQAWRHVRTRVRRVSSTQEFAYVMTTDGFKNSHASVEDYLRSCVEYIALFREQGKKEMEDNLRGWLEETSREGCGDDITMVMVASHRFRYQDIEEHGSKGTVTIRGGVIDAQSQEILEYVDRPGNNDPCPCGSGKKYKNCCRVNTRKIIEAQAV